MSADVQQLVDKAHQLRGAREKLDALIEANDAKLIALGAGKYVGNDPELAVTVIVPAAPSPSFKLDPKQLDQARELAGESFRDVFDRKVVFSPCKAFAEVVRKFFTPAKAEKLIALCRVQREQQRPYVKLA